VPAKQGNKWMGGRQRLERRDKIPDVLVRGSDTKPAAILLKHVHAGPSVWRIDHQVDGAFGLERGAKRAQTRIGISEMMQHAGTDNQIELALELTRTLER